jgi:hypothetical protein
MFGTENESKVLTRRSVSNAESYWTMTIPGRPKVYGAAYSTYVRTVRLTLEEKGVSYDLVEVDVFAAGGASVEYLKINPFGRIPSFEHGDFRMYERNMSMILRHKA